MLFARLFILRNLLRLKSRWVVFWESILAYAAWSWKNYPMTWMIGIISLQKIKCFLMFYDLLWQIHWHYLKILNQMLERIEEKFMWHVEYFFRKKFMDGYNIQHLYTSRSVLSPDCLRRFLVCFKFDRPKEIHLINYWLCEILGLHNFKTVEVWNVFHT